MVALPRDEAPRQPGPGHPRGPLTITEAGRRWKAFIASQRGMGRGRNRRGPQPLRGTVVPFYRRLAREFGISQATVENRVREARRQKLPTEVPMHALVPLVRAGLTQPQIGARLGYHERTIRLAVVQARDDGLLPPRPRVGHGQIIRLVTAGRTAAEITAMTGATRAAIAGHVTRARRDGEIPPGPLPSRRRAWAEAGEFLRARHLRAREARHAP